MIQLKVKTNTASNTKNVDINSTPAEVINELGLSTAGCQININGTLLSAVDLQASFADLGIADNTTASMNMIVKADGANS